MDSQSRSMSESVLLWRTKNGETLFLIGTIIRAKDVAKDIVQAVEHGKEVATIDWRYRLLVGAWQLIPRWIWTRLTFAK